MPGPGGKKAQSHVINAVLATAVLYWVLDLSASGRTMIDWAVITLVTLAITWNVVRLARRLRVLGGAAVWHVLRTVLFWVIGLMNVAFRAPKDTTTWTFVLGLVLVGTATFDTVALYRKERSTTVSGAARQ